MSRIAGLWQHKSTFQHKETVKQMLRVVAAESHKQEQVMGDDHCMLGVIAHGVQSCHIGSISVVIDGHIYNRSDLGGFPTDAQSIAELYRQYGFRRTVELCNGDFAIALYDDNTQTLSVARDRIGVKPLYYARLQDGIALASRSRSLFCVEGISQEPNPMFVARYAGLHYRYIDNAPQESPYRDIEQLPAASILTYTNGAITIERYWSLQELPDWTDSEEHLAERYRELLLDAVSIRFKRAREPVFTLSGGMDSSSVLASAVRTSGNKQQAVSTVYVDKTYDESDEIATMLESTVSEWRRVVVGNPDVFSILPRIIQANDEPIATGTWLSHFLLCEEIAHKGFRSVFGGLGGDELNAGEYEYFFFHFADLKKNNHHSAYLHEVEKWVEYHDHPIFKKNLHVAEDGLQTMVDMSSAGVCRPEPKRFTRYAATINKDYVDLSKFFPMMEHPFSSYLKNRTYQDMFFETAPCCLRAEDRQTMAFGLDNFVPFFDYRLVEFMFRVPGTMKIRDGVTKILLREATKGLLPDETRTRIKKTGWNAPAHKWFSGKGKEPLYDMIHSQAFRERGIWSVPEVLRIADEHQHIIDNDLVQDNHMMFLWQLVNMEVWLTMHKTS